MGPPEDGNARVDTKSSLDNAVASSIDPTPQEQFTNSIQAGHSQIDITSLLSDVALNHLSVKDPFLSGDMPDTFNLHDAMAASQLMDRKMDSCEVAADQIAPWNSPDERIFPRPIPDGLEDPMTPLPWEDLTITHSTYICLEIVVRMQSLLTGSSVGESTFTCLYAHQPVVADMRSRLLDSKSSKDNLLSDLANLHINQSTTAQWSVFACVTALVEITEAVRGIILNADIYEEEDFAANTHNLRFFKSADASEILEFVLSRIGNLPKSDERHILEAILGYQGEFLKICASLEKLSGNELIRTVISAQVTVRTAVQRLRDLQISSELFLKHTRGSDDCKAMLQQVFDSFVNRPLVGNLPIRKVSFRQPEEAISILISVTSEIDTCVCSLLLRGSSLGRIGRMLDQVGQSNILSRSLILLNLYFADNLLGQYDLRDLIVEHIHQWQPVQNDTSLSSSDPNITFLNRLAKPMYDSLKLRILNRNRQRAYIEVVMLPEWISLQQEAQLADTQWQQTQIKSSNPMYFTRFALIIMIRLMCRYVEAGIQVGLFHNNHSDMCFAYWYLDFLYSALNQNLSQMKGPEKPSRSAETPSHSLKNRGKKKNKAKASPTNNDVHTLDQHSPTAAELENSIELKLILLKRNMYRKTVQFMAALSQAGILKEPSYEFTTPERIFEKRFEVFGAIYQPPPLTYEHFREGSDYSQVSPSDLVHSVMEGFQYCRSTIDQLLEDLKKLDAMYAPATEDELRSLVKVCIGNRVYVQKLSQLAESGQLDSASVQFDYDTHDIFCIIKVSS